MPCALKEDRQLVHDHSLQLDAVQPFHATTIHHDILVVYEEIKL